VKKLALFSETNVMDKLFGDNILKNHNIPEARKNVCFDIGKISYVVNCVFGLVIRVT
jgi:hypothetical protein